MQEMKHEYRITSDRAYRRNDEADNIFYSDHEYILGERIVLDGLGWTIVKVIK